MELTARQGEILAFVAQEQAAGRICPTHREIAAHFGFSGPNAAARHINALIVKGALVADASKARSLRVLSPLSRFKAAVAEIPLLGVIPAGLPMDCEEGAEGCVRVDVESIGFKPTRNTFALRVSGDSMIGAHILPGDIVVMEHGPEPRSGEIVAAWIDGACTLKTFLLQKGKPVLRAENPKYPKLVPVEELMIQGVFRALIRKAKEAA